MPNKMHSLADCQQGGSVLLLVLILIGAVVFLAAESMRLVRMNYAGSVYMRALFKSGSVLESVQELSHMYAKNASSSVTTLRQGWVDFGLDLDSISDALSSGELTGNMSDENSLFPINALSDSSSVGDQLSQVFERLVDSVCQATGVEGDPVEFVLAVRCWVGGTQNCADEVVSDDTGSTYSVPGAKMRTLSELLLVPWPGVSKEDKEKVYEGTSSSLGLKDLVTVWSPGPINVNTASVELLKSLPVNLGVADDFVEEIVDYRTDEDHELNDDWFDNIFKKPQYAVNASVPMHFFKSKSSYFRSELNYSDGLQRKRSFEVFKVDNENIYIVYRDIY